MPDFDPTVPSIARIYDYALGGKENYEADRVAFRKLLKSSPFYVEVCRECRAFLGRAVQAAVRAGIRQFLDIGSGLPTQQNVHEIAQRDAPGSRVVYVDYDQVVVSHTQELLTGTDNTWVIRQDVRQPQQILDDKVVKRRLDWDQPVMILLVSVLHFVSDRDRPGEIVRRLTDGAAPGSYVAIAHGTDEGIPARNITGAGKVFKHTPALWVPRRAPEIVRWLDGMRILDPGAVPVSAWHPSAPQDARDAAWTGTIGVVAEVMPRPSPAPAG